MYFFQDFIDESLLILLFLIALAAYLHLYMKWKTHRWDKKKISVGMIRHWNTIRPAFNDEEMKVLRNINSHDLFVEAPEEYQQLRKSLLIVINFFEQTSIAILTGLADEHFLRAYFQSSLVLYYRVFSSHIKYLRERSDDSGIYINFETVANKWEEKERIIRAVL